jgi:hypothetical protein
MRFESDWVLGFWNFLAFAVSAFSAVKDLDFGFGKGDWKCLW